MQYLFGGFFFFLSGQRPTAFSQEGQIILICVTTTVPFSRVNTNAICLVRRADLSLHHYFLKGGRTARPGFPISQICGFYFTAPRGQGKQRNGTREGEGPGESDDASADARGGRLPASFAWLTSR